ESECAVGRRDRRRQIRLPFKVPVDRRRCSATFGNRPNNERLAAPRIARNEYAWRSGREVGIAHNAAALQRDPVDTGARGSVRADETVSARQAVRAREAEGEE